MGRYLVLSQNGMRHLYRFFLLDEVLVDVHKKVGPGQLVARASSRTYFDILRHGTGKGLTWLPREPRPELFVNVEALHDVPKGLTR